MCATLGVLLNGAAFGYTGVSIPSMVRRNDSVFTEGRDDPSMWGDSLDMSFQTASWVGES